MNIVPRPLEVEAHAGSFALSPRTTILVGPGPERTREVALHLAAELGRRLGPRTALRVEETAAPRPGAVHLGGSQDRELGDEGHEIRILADSVALRAPHAAGLFHGAQSLLQLLPQDGVSIPAALIRDRPRYRWRGMHLDVGRHFFPKEFLKRYIDLIALHKMNTFHWHLTEDQGWRLEIASYPRLTEVGAWRMERGGRHGGFYTQNDVREVLEHARSRFVNVVPEIELPGHAVAALAAYPEISCTGGPFEVETAWGIFDDVYCAGNDATFTFLERILGEVIALFPGEYVHVGGDECPKTRWRSCPRCQARIRAEGFVDEEALQSWFVTRIARFLDAHGKRLIGWDEILEGGLPAGATVMSWRGTAGGVHAARSGHDVVMTPTSHCYFDYFQSDRPGEPGAHGVIPLEKVYAFEPTPGELTATEAQHVLGTQGNVWTERMTTPAEVEYMTLPRLCALAEVAWTAPARRDWSDFRRRLDVHLGRLDTLGFHYRHPE